LDKAYVFRGIRRIGNWTYAFSCEVQALIHRVFFAGYGVLNVWKAGCRKIIALDGCFLKRPNQGEILTAIERDGNNHIYPVAWAMVNVENKDNLTLFLELLEQDLGCSRGNGLTLMSDQHKVDRGCKAIENIFSECFNSVIVNVRHKPLLTMLEAIRVIVLKRMNKLRLTLITNNCKFWHVIPAGEILFEELYTECSTLARKLRWRGRSWMFDLNKSDLYPSFVKGLTAKGLGPSSGGFLYGAKDSIATQTCELSKVEFNDFLTLYPILSKYHVILPKSNQTIFDAPPGFVYLGLTLLVVPSSPLLLSCARLMVVSPLSTSIEGSSICVELYSQLLSEQNKLDSKSFKDKLPLNIEDNPMFQRLGRYPTSVHVFPDPILFLAGLKPWWEYGQQRPAIMAGDKAFRNFIYTEDDEELSFLPKEPSSGFCSGSPSVSVNMKPLKADEELVIQPAEVMADSRESPKLEVLSTSSSKNDVPYLTVSDGDEGLPDVLELKNATVCHLKITSITPPV
ncbi:hypothetical protein Tco_1447521, partial [Tanacetum coccineum]